MYLVRTSKPRADGKPWHYYILRDTIWDKRLKRQRHIYRAYIGHYPVISESKARTICRKLGITLDDLKRVRGLKIISG